MTPQQQRISDRLDEALWAALTAAAAAERQQLFQRPRDEFEGRRVHPAFRAALGYLHRPSWPLRRPGPRGQLALGVP